MPVEQIVGMHVADLWGIEVFEHKDQAVPGLLLRGSKRRLRGLVRSTRSAADTFAVQLFDLSGPTPSRV